MYIEPNRSDYRYAMGPINMTEQSKTVDVQPISGYSALKLTWQYQIDKRDLQPAFQKITKALHSSESPLYIVVDLSHDPQFPIADTLMEALRGPFRHPKLAEWLVFGSNRSARTIGELLTKASRRDNIRWFSTEAEVMAYLENTLT